MEAISALGYFCIGASDLARWERFATELLGMQASRTDGGERLRLRMDEHAARVIVEESADDDLLAAGWELPDAPALERYVDELRDRGIEARPAPGELADARCVEKIYTCSDHDGIRHEFYCGAKLAPFGEPFHSPVLDSSFVTGALGVGHFVSATQSYAKALAFYGHGLGLKVSDRIRAPLATPAGTIDFDATFFHAATGRHHSLATAELRFPKRIHHIMVEVSDFKDVQRAYDRFLRAGIPIMMGIGHHPNDKMTSFYGVTPSGFGVEFGWGGVVIKDKDWPPGHYSQLSDWGHAPPAAVR